MCRWSVMGPRSSRTLAWVMTVVAVVGGAGCGAEPRSGGAVRESATAEVRRSAATASPPVRFSELHYDNAGTDTGEAVEISGPAGTDLTGWTVVLYNGGGGASAVYDTKVLSGALPATCGARGLVVVNYPANGIQNGGSTVTGTSDPDGLALVDAGGVVVEFLSYEGVISAASGPAAGLTSIDLGVRELGNTAEGTGRSLQRDAGGTWMGPTPSTFGACNDGDTSPPPPQEVVHVSVTPATVALVTGASRSLAAAALDGADQPIAGVSFVWSSDAPTVASVSPSGVVTAMAAGRALITAAAPSGVAGSATIDVTTAPPSTVPETRVTEIHYDNTGADVGEAVEIEGPAGADLTGWSLVLYDGNGGIAYGTSPIAAVIPAACGQRGVVVVPYPANGLQNGPDGLALVDAGGQVVEFLSYEGVFTATTGPASGLTSSDIGAAEASSASIGSSLQRDASNHWAPGAATFGTCNGDGPPPPPATNTIGFSGRLPGDPALPVGFQDQLFATVRDGNNTVVPTTITWSSETPAVASIDQDGVMTALSEGAATFRATAADGVTTATITLPTRVAVASTTAVYDGNAEFGEPSDADPSDDFIVRHRQYTASYNPTRGTPNWVSYDLDASHFGAEDRCDCFTFDPDLPAGFSRYTTAEYTGAAAIAGFSIDRGHLARSFDRTSASLDNAFTFLFSNVVPQASDLNQGPWAQLENELGDRARFQNKEVYVITGVAGSRGTLKNQGKVVIPASTWKVAVIMERDHGLADVRDYRDLEVIAVDMPNTPGVRNVPWQTYATTVDAIEALTGYDLLALLPDRVEAAVEAGQKPPLGALDGPYVGEEGGAAITMSAAASLDPNGTIVSYAWDFGDGATAAGPAVAHAYAQDGIYPVRLVVTDDDGLTDTVVTTATVSNVAPVVAPIAGATLLIHQTYQASGSFADPGSDPGTATVDYGDGSGPAPLALDGRTFALAHVYDVAGTFTVTVSISDGTAVAAALAAVTVTAPPPPPPPPPPEICTPSGAGPGSRRLDASDGSHGRLGRELEVRQDRQPRVRGLDQAAHVPPHVGAGQDDRAAASRP